MTKQRRFGAHFAFYSFGTSLKTKIFPILFWFTSNTKACSLLQGSLPCDSKGLLHQIYGTSVLDHKEEIRHHYCCLQC